MNELMMVMLRHSITVGFVTALRHHDAICIKLCFQPA